MSDILGERDPNVPDRPTKVAEPSRESRLPKRFYKSAAWSPFEAGFAIELDGRPVRTPGRARLAVPDAGLADVLVAEWDGQGERIDPMTMPLTRLANTAIDGVAQDMEAVVEDLARFAGTDLTCYRATGPSELVHRQAAACDPMLEWAQRELNASFLKTAGIVHVAQPSEGLAAVRQHVAKVREPLALAALHVVTSLTGSALIAVALHDRALPADAAWSAAHVDEDWNIEEWGGDDEAEARRAQRRLEFDAASHVLGVLR